MIDFLAHRQQPVAAAGRGIQLGDALLESGDTVAGAEIGEVAAGDLRAALDDYARQTRGGYPPQLAALMFFITGRQRALDGYFPLIKALDSAAIDRFYGLAARIVEHPAFDLRLFDEGRRLADIPADAAYLVAGQIAEIFFQRTDILDRLLSAPRQIWLYTTPRAFAEGGGVAGGCYSPASGSLQLVLARLYEGFYGPAPGAAPFLHEFGHMLDHFDAASGAQGPSTGLLPGLRSGDGAIFTPAARELFLRGKRLELHRYLRRCDALADDEPPIGHPYVFQNNTEFIAGYFEMFFRNPHYFARQNPDLYGGFASLLRQDPRAVWDEDFPVYVEDNRRFYLSGERPAPTQITLPW